MTTTMPVGDDKDAVLLPADYKPSDAEEFMNPLQREYFRQKLRSQSDAWKLVVWKPS